MTQIEEGEANRLQVWHADVINNVIRNFPGSSRERAKREEDSGRLGKWNRSQMTSFRMDGQKAWD
jgi:hypothetical protein